MAEEELPIIWMCARPDRFEEQRKLAIQSGILPSDALPKTYEEWNAKFMLGVQHLIKLQVQHQIVDVSPQWVKKRLQETRKPMTAENVLEVLRYPIGRINFERYRLKCDQSLQ